MDAYIPALKVRGFTLNEIETLLKNAGIEQPSVLSGRRAFAVELHRLGYDVAHILHMLGNRTLETTQKLLTTDPVSMWAIAANAS